jgi:hypothetical protein
MTDTKHTKGTWRWEYTEHRDPHDDFIKPETWLVAVDNTGKTNVVLGYQGCGSHCIDVSPEDAALIEAAPDLLDACELALTALAGVGLRIEHPVAVALATAINKARRLP